MNVMLQTLTFSSLEEIPVLAKLLAQDTAYAEDIQLGIHELLLNALEHGNLGIGFKTKTRLLQEGAWQEEMMRRLNFPYNAWKRVTVHIEEHGYWKKFRIMDEGKGFNWQHYLSQQPNIRLPHGRGLMIARGAGFNSLYYNAVGNEVTCLARKAAAEFSAVA